MMGLIRFLGYAATRSALARCADRSSSGSVQRGGRFVEHRGIRLEDVGHPGGDVEGDLDIGDGGYPREAKRVVEQNLVTSGLDDQGRQAGQVSEYGADQAEGRVLSLRIVGDTGREQFSVEQRVDVALGVHGRSGEGEIDVRGHQERRGGQSEPVIAGVDQGGDREPGAGGVSREGDVRRGDTVVQEGFIRRKGVVDRRRIRVSGASR